MARRSGTFGWMELRWSVPTTISERKSANLAHIDMMNDKKSNTEWDRTSTLAHPDILPV